MLISAGNLMDKTPSNAFAKTPMTNSDVTTIFGKVSTQPPQATLGNVTQWPTNPTPAPSSLPVLFPQQNPVDTPSLPPTSIFSKKYDEYSGIPLDLREKITVRSPSDLSRTPSADLCFFEYY